MAGLIAAAVTVPVVLLLASVGGGDHEESRVIAGRRCGVSQRCRDGLSNISALAVAQRKATGTLVEGVRNHAVHLILAQPGRTLRR